MQKSNSKKPIREPQHQEMPGHERDMKPRPIFDYPDLPGSEKLKNKIALITGGDSGIGKAVAILFAKEGADIVIAYLSEHDDAADTKHIIEEKYGRRCVAIAADVTEESNCRAIVEKTAAQFNRIDILVNNAAVQYENKSFEEMDTTKMVHTFKTNIFSMFWMTKAALVHMESGGCIINTASVTPYRGSPALVDYASTKGAIVAFTRSLASNLIEKGIRVNGVAPGPVWTPLIVSSFDPDKVAEHGSDAPMNRAGEPVEIAPSYLFLASSDASYMSGQFLHPNGGEIVNA